MKTITVLLHYKGHGEAARHFAEEMEASGTAEQIRTEEGNLRYEYFFPMNDPESVLLVDSWRDQAAIDVHHASPMMAKILELREKYGLTVTAERYVRDEMPESDAGFVSNDIRNEYDFVESLKNPYMK